MNAGKAFGPCTAQEFGEHGFGLVVESVCGARMACDCVHLGQELPKPGDSAAGAPLLQWIRDVGLVSFGGGVDAGLMEGNIEVFGEGFREGEIGVGFIAAQAVMQMGGVENKAQFPRLSVRQQGAQERDGIGSAGKADGETQARGAAAWCRAEVKRARKDDRAPSDGHCDESLTTAYTTQHA